MSSELADEETLNWLNLHCTSIRIANDSREYIGSWQVDGNILDAARIAMSRLKEGEEEINKTSDSSTKITL